MKGDLLSSIGANNPQCSRHALEGGQARPFTGDFLNIPVDTGAQTDIRLPDEVPEDLSILFDGSQVDRPRSPSLQGPTGLLQAVEVEFPGYVIGGAQGDQAEVHFRARPGDLVDHDMKSRVPSRSRHSPVPAGALSGQCPQVFFAGGDHEVERDLPFSKKPL